MSTGDQKKLELILRECGIHACRMEHARGVYDSCFPLDETSYSSLTDNQLAHDYEDDAETAGGTSGPNR